MSRTSGSFHCCALLLGLALLLAASLARGEPTSAPAPVEGKQGLPRLDHAKDVTRVHGKIVQSTRGRPGPVRLLVESPNGDAISMLTCPEKLCDELGLSLRIGETIDASGQLVPGTPPLLVVSEIVVEGRTARLRDSNGRWVDAAGEGAAAPGKGTPAGP